MRKKKELKEKFLKTEEETWKLKNGKRRKEKKRKEKFQM